MKIISKALFILLSMMLLSGCMHVFDGGWNPDYACFTPDGSKLCLPLWMSEKFESNIAPAQKLSQIDNSWVSYYLFQYKCRDCGVELYDHKGNYICSPWGSGWAAKDNKCPDWVAGQVQNASTIWAEEPRKQ